MQTLPKMAVYRRPWPSTPKRVDMQPQMPPESDESDLDSSLDEEPQAKPASKFPWIAVLTSAAVSLVISASAVWAGVSYFTERQENMLAIMHHDDARQEYRRNAAESMLPKINANSEAVNMLTLPTAKMFAVSGTRSRPQARARVFIDEARGKCAIYASGLPAMEAGKTYELWLTDAKGKRLSAGTFDASQDGTATFAADIPYTLDHVTEVAVSSEPEQGPSQPSGEFLIQTHLK